MSLTKATFSMIDGAAVNVLDFGADNTGSTSSTAAVQAAITFAKVNNKKIVYLPAGTYLVDQAGTFDLGAVNGFHIKGDGLGVTVVNFINSNTAVAPADNYLCRNNNDGLRILFEGIRFQGDSTNRNSRFYYMTSASNAQSIRFIDCMWYQFGTLFTLEGTANASEMLFIGCKASEIYEVLYNVANTQSVNHLFYGCDFETCYAGIWKFTKGGDLAVFGGSFITSDDPTGAVTNWMLEVDDTSGSYVGYNNWNYRFYGMRTEINGASTLVRNNSGGQVKFSECDLVIGGTSTRQIAYLADQARVIVDGGQLNGEWYLDVNSTSTWSAVNRTANLELNNAQLRAGFSFIIEGLTLFGGTGITNLGGVGRVKMRRCRDSQGVATNNVLDADYGWQYGNVDQAVESKFAIIRAPNKAGGLPQQTGGATIVLPLGSVIVSTRLVHPAQSGATGQVYYLKDADGITLDSWTFNAADTVNAKTDVFFDCDTTNKRTISFTGDAANAATSYNGYLVVEYL